MRKAPYDEVMLVCPICGGTGIVLDHNNEESHCAMCDGSGTVERDDEEYREWVEAIYNNPDEKDWDR